MSCFILYHISIPVCSSYKTSFTVMQISPLILPLLKFVMKLELFICSFWKHLFLFYLLPVPITFYISWYRNIYVSISYNFSFFFVLQVKLIYTCEVTTVWWRHCYVINDVILVSCGYKFCCCRYCYFSSSKYLFYSFYWHHITILLLYPVYFFNDMFFEKRRR